MQTVYSIFLDSMINALITQGENQNLEIRCGSLSCSLFCSQYKQYENFNFASEKITSKTALGDYSEKTFASTRSATEVSSEIKKFSSTA